MIIDLYNDQKSNISKTLNYYIGIKNQSKKY